MKDAATVVLLRDGAGGIEVYLLHRVRSMAFASGMYVFPGGTVDPQDSAFADPVISAAVRETFEETGALVAVRPLPPPSSWENDRIALVRHETTIAEVLQRHGAVVVPEVLHAWSRWITPTGDPRRYDTRFFVTALPEGQEPRHVGGEAQWAGWIRPADTDELPMLPPTRITLAELAGYDSVEQVLAAAPARDLAPIRPVRRGQRVQLPDGSVI